MAHSSGRDSLVTTLPAGPAPGERISPGADPEKRRRILDAAVQTFGRLGFHEARIAEIASAAKVAEGTVYLYFRNKEDLLGVIFDESMDGVLEEARRVRDSEDGAAARLAGLVDLHLTFLASDRDLASVFQIELRRSARLVERFSRSKLVEYFRLLGDVLRDGIASGEFRKDLDPRLAVRILFGAADEILSEWLLSGEPAPSFHATELVETLLGGFAARELSSKVKRARGAAREVPAAGRAANSIRRGIEDPSTAEKSGRGAQRVKAAAGAAKRPGLDARAPKAIRSKRKSP